MIRSIGHVALRVCDLDAALEHATQILGLHEVERSDGTVYLTCDASHHGLQLIRSDQVALDHVAFEAAGVEGLERLRDVLVKEGVPIVSEEPEEAGITQAIRFLGPAGILFEVYADMGRVNPHYNSPGVRPVKLQHLTLRSERVEEMGEFLGLLGFKLSDRIGDMIIWMRCNPDHHGVAVIRGGNGLHHYAWEVEGWSDLERLGDHLLANGKRFMFGPGRHGPGLNLFCYHLDGAGVLVEYTADLVRIYDDAAYEPLDWPNTPESINQWGPAAPEEFLAQATPAAEPATSSA